MARQVALVGDIMSTRLVTVSPDDGLAEALALMSDHEVRRLPVVKTVSGEALLVGIVTDRDLRLAVDSPYLHPDVQAMLQDLRRLTVADVMTKDVVTCFPSATVKRAAALMLERRIGGLPVVEQEEGRTYLVGLLTRSDLLELLIARERDPELEPFPR